MTEKKPKRPRDVSQLAKMMIDEASGETGATVKDDKPKTKNKRKPKAVS